ncbi:MAG: 1-acyl-sn-glycerol-3-phosphate acyltransferase [Ilumatobacter sp.]|nr:1-acyl-sn-glycerol-3-phosphate acyltransferase [Ilumatobacter sp.]
MSSPWRRPGVTGAIVYALAASVFGSMVTIFSRLQVERQRGRRRVATALPAGPIIVVSNHTSYADGVLLALVCRRLGRTLRLLATSGVFRAPVIGSIVRRLGFIRVERGSVTANAALAHAADALAAGEAIGIFPEGRLTRDPDKWPEQGRTGAVRLALATGAPIVPIAMVGAHRLLGRRRFVSTMIRNVIMRPRVETRVGAPIDVLTLFPGGDTADPVAVRRATDALMERLIDLVEDVRDELAPHPSGVPVA